MHYKIIRGEFPCTFCDKAEDLLTQKGVKFEVCKLDMADLIMAQAKYSHHTVPLILVDGMILGGFSALEIYFNR